VPFAVVVPATDGKLIEEHHGLATTHNDISIAHMVLQQVG
jgi:hypothetical protein